MLASAASLGSTHARLRLALILTVVLVAFVSILSRSAFTSPQIKHIWKTASSFRAKTSHETGHKAATHLEVDVNGKHSSHHSTLLSSTEDDYDGDEDFSYYDSPIKASEEDQSEEYGYDGRGYLSQQPAAPQSLASDATDICASAPDSSNIFISMKTGASVLHAKLPAHLLTLWNCIHKDQIMIFSDLEDTYAGHKVHDAVANVSSVFKDGNDDFEQYRQLQMAREQRTDPNNLRGGRAWELDKWKFLPLTFSVWEHAPAHIEWFVFIEADTSVSWLNLLLWLKTWDPKKELYIGAPRVVNDVGFAHGGSGYVMSRPALAKLAAFREEEDPEVYDYRWENFTNTNGFGDAIVARALKEVGVKLENGDPFVQSEPLQTIELTEGKLCNPVVTLHHVDGVLISDLWQMQSDWVKKYGWHEPYLRKHIFDYFIADVIVDTRYEWTNFADRRRLIANESAFEDELRRDDFILKEKMNEAEQAAIVSQDSWDCVEACEKWEECMQWQWRPGRCYLGSDIRLGQMYVERDAEKDHKDRKEWKERDKAKDTEKWIWTSGWHRERVEKLRLKVDTCAWDPKPHT